MLHHIQLNDLPPEGRLFEGEIRTDLFGLSGPDAPRFVPPLRFALTVRVDGPDIVVEGSTEAQFELLCTRCGQWFPFEGGDEQYFSQEPREGASTLDLTAHIREDILLALPGHPRCEESNVESRSCPAAGRFAPESEYTALTEEETETLRQTDVWGVLDRIQPGTPPQDPSTSH